MEAEIWQRLPEELLFMILARLPIRVLGKMRTVCKQWNYFLSSRETLQQVAPNWSLHSTPGFLIQIHWDWEDDVEYWVTEGLGSYIYKVPLPNGIVVDSCKSICCCHTKGDMLDLYIGIPGTGSWRHLPRPPISHFSFNGMAFNSSTGRCTLLLGYSRNQGQNRRIEMCIYDSESNAWTAVSMMVPDHIQPFGKGIFSKGKFYWASFSPINSNIIVVFNIADERWTEIPLPEGYRYISLPQKLCGYDGQVVLVERKWWWAGGGDCLRMWKLNEAEQYEMWCDLRAESHSTERPFPFVPSVAVNNSGLIMVINSRMKMSIFSVSIFNTEGELIVREMRLPGIRTQQQAVRQSVSAFEFNNMWWP